MIKLKIIPRLSYHETLLVGQAASNHFRWQGTIVLFASDWCMLNTNPIERI